MITNKFLLPAILAIKFITTISNDFEINGQNQSIVKRIILHELQSFLEEKFETLILDFSIKKNIFLKIEEIIEKEKIFETLEIKKILITIYEKALTENGIKNSGLEKIGEILKIEENNETEDLVKRIREKINKAIEVEKKVSEAQSELNDLQQSEKLLQQKINSKETPSEDLEKNRKDLENIKDQIKELDKKLKNSVLDYLDKYKDKKKETKKKLDQNKSKKEKIEARLKKSTEEIIEIESEISEKEIELNLEKIDSKIPKTDDHRSICDLIDTLFKIFEARELIKQHEKKYKEAQIQKDNADEAIYDLEFNNNNFDFLIRSQESEKNPQGNNIETDEDKRLKSYIEKNKRMIDQNKLIIAEKEKERQEEFDKKTKEVRNERKADIKAKKLGKSLESKNYGEKIKKIQGIFISIELKNRTLDQKIINQKKIQEKINEINKEKDKLEEEYKESTKQINDLHEKWGNRIVEKTKDKNKKYQLKNQESLLTKKIENEEKNIKTEIENLNKELNSVKDSIKNSEDKLTSAENELTEINKDNSPIKIKETKPVISLADTERSSIGLKNPASSDSGEQIPTIPVKTETLDSKKDINLKPQVIEVSKITDGKPDNKQSVIVDEENERKQNESDPLVTEDNQQIIEGKLNDKQNLTLDKGSNKTKNNKDTHKKDDKDGSNVWIWVLGVLGVLVIGVILFFLVKEKK